MKKQLLTLLTTASVIFLAGCADTPEAAGTDMVTDTETTEEIANTVTKQTLEEWLTEIGKQGTICMAVWNDATGYKQVLDEGATYQFCQGDELAVYLPENYIYDSTNMGNDNLTLIVNVVWIDWTGVDLGKEFTFEATAQNTDTLEIFTTHVTSDTINNNYTQISTGQMCLIPINMAFLVLCRVQ